MTQNTNFDNKVKQVIEQLSDKIELQDLNFQIDLEYASEVLTIELDGRVFVINKQAPLKEIWLASPISGPYHFKEIEGVWEDSKGNILHKILSSELSKLSNQEITL